ncbi:ParB/RepB/Spo0J family partition protein [Litoreibacter janthinus]|uniref:Chromosome partitioning protein, ParB family n=1 Tax=Litoreibacter janthinus TaxID=670154 RepID=A0A1I6IES1_9RHOB|nr:ParB/RepB/Spo0J family partition protein [Litoreibacter janthinus]SFR65265.1 chromosome partitioning protein, ParB family [Litoreibacter janthinus]
MTRDNKFGFAPLETKSVAPRERSVGPMGAAVRDAAESLTESTEAKVEQRRQNAEDAKAFRVAAGEGRVLTKVDISEVHTDDLPRDRLELEAVAQSDEMEELKASIRARGQKEPVELYRGPDGRLQLKKGWRRFTAISQLSAETGDAAFATITARVVDGDDLPIDRYIDMVEENVVREDLTFAEMAQVAITAAQDEAVKEQSADELVNRLYGALHKMKKSYIRSFVLVLETLRDELRWPKAISRNLGVDVAKALKAGQGDLADLRTRLNVAETADAQNAVLADFAKAAPKQEKPKLRVGRQKFEFHVGQTKVTARQGECRIVSKQDYASVPKARLQRAIKAFEDALKDEGNPRVTTL